MPFFVGGTTTFLKTIVKPLLLVETLFDSVTILNIVIKAALAWLIPRLWAKLSCPALTILYHFTKSSLKADLQLLIARFLNNEPLCLKPFSSVPSRQDLKLWGDSQSNWPNDPQCGSRIKHRFQGLQMLSWKYSLCNMVTVSIRRILIFLVWIRSHYDIETKSS